MFNIRESVLNFKEKHTHTHTHTLFFSTFKLPSANTLTLMTDPLNIIFYDFSI